MEIIYSKEQKAEIERLNNKSVGDEFKELSKGRLSIRWSQMRAGYAMFVSGRMVGQLFDTENDARNYLKKTHGIEL